MAEGCDPDELDRTKKHISGSIVLALEGMSSRMMRMSRNELTHKRDIPVEETLQRVESVTNDDIVELANRILKPELVSTTAIGPFSE
jgi:predicted Zn-dependent peptidase